MNDAFRLLSRLEAVDLQDSTLADVGLAERAKHLSALAAFDTAALTESQRKEMRTRLQRLIQADANLLLEARAEMREIDKGRKNASRGRAAARGYRAANPRIQPALDQDA
ncbi:MAG: hypothetical protein ACI9KE_001828 [Polyangiales bacterium]|jgi:hypothetical protein